MLGAFFTVLTVQRTRQIGLLKAMGASNGYVLRDGVGQMTLLVAAATLAGAAGPAFAIDLEPLPDGMARAQIGDLTLFHDPKAWRIDGEAGTPVYQFERVPQMNVLRFDATSTAHALRPDGTACVIGVGGGRDLLTALAAGHDRVFGAEVNPAMIEMLHRVADRSPPENRTSTASALHMFSTLSVICLISSRE